MKGMIEGTASRERTADSVVVVNPRLQGLKCIRCGEFYATDDGSIDAGLGCQKCLSQGFPVGLTCVYQGSQRHSTENHRSGMFRYSPLMPFIEFPSLGEGNTPYVSIDKLARELGVRQVAIKNEAHSPTGSHKDRMSPLAVARAIHAGFKKVIASSSGNAGASLAAYAARAGLECCIIAAPDIDERWAAAIKATGAKLEIVQDRERWTDMERFVREDGWFPVTNFNPQPTSSNPFGIEGYKTIAYEIIEQSAKALPTVVVVPACRGDLLFGIYKGFADAMLAGLIREIPRLVAAEPGKRLELVLSGADYRSVFDVPPNDMTSIDGTTATYQSWKALSESGGTAVSVESEAVYRAKSDLARLGFHAETSSAAALAGLRKLRVQERLSSDDRVAVILTSHGYKNSHQAAETQPRATRECN